MHPADADYTMDNLPDEAVLMEMADSALALAAMMSGQQVQRRVRVSREDATIGPTMAEQYLRRRQEPVVVPQSFYDAAVLDAAVDAATGEPGTATAAESATIASSLAVLREHASRLRGLAIAQDGVMVHALNSIDLGLIGLAKVMGDAD